MKVRSQDGMEFSVQKRSVLGVAYTHLRFPTQDDLYVTQYGFPFVTHLLPGNLFLDQQWFQSHSVRLEGSSTIYRVQTREFHGRALDIVLKWNRMGQDVPVPDVEDDPDCEFNSPFEEFSLLMELRNSRWESPGTIYTHRPLAIYVPHERKDLDRLGRRTARMLRVLEAHPDLKLDIFRAYAVIYEWVKGIDAVQAVDQGLLTVHTMEELTLAADRQMRQKGFVVHDRKPHHVIVRPKMDRTLTRDRNGDILYALVDFELLKRTPEREETMKTSKYGVYLRKQRDKFQVTDRAYPPGLQRVNLFGVDYVFGNVASTQGRLWVVGRDPELFDYFLPERWEVTPRIKLRALSEVYHTVTKDEIHIIWKVSLMGSKPDMDPFDERERRILEFGYNSPFEEFGLAQYLSGKGIPTILPLAIYMAGHKIEMADFVVDDSRYVNHEPLLNPDGTPLLRRDRAYITIWGDWSCADYDPNPRGIPFAQRLSALHAFRKNLIGAESYFRLMETLRARLLAVGVEDLNLRGGHFLISLDKDGALARDERGEPDLRICDFELLKHFHTFD